MAQNRSILGAYFLNMVVFPNVKINLGLFITGKRSDGYHELESIFYPVPWCDILEIIPSKNFEFHPSGISVEGEPSTNLVVRAYELLKNQFQLPPVAIYLHKVIPTGAGLGGGSADGAFTLSLLNELFELNLSKEELCSFAAQLGSDCPFFILNTPCLVTGRGEILSPIDFSLAGKWIKLVHPGVHISTKMAFEGIKSYSAPNSLTTSTINQNKISLNHFINDFEKGITEVFPPLRELREALLAEGANYVSMSGSGSAFYGIFDQEPPGNRLGPYQFITRLE